jgi:hypothetical protein
MAKFVLVYTGDATMGESPEDQQSVMEAWMNWFGSLGESVLDVGNPFGSSCAVASDGAVSDGAPARLGGYSIIEADDPADAAGKVKGCPVLSAGAGSRSTRRCRSGDVPRGRRRGGPRGPPRHPRCR